MSMMLPTVAFMAVMQIEFASCCPMPDNLMFYDVKRQILYSKDFLGEESVDYFSGRTNF